MSLSKLYVWLVVLFYLGRAPRDDLIDDVASSGRTIVTAKRTKLTTSYDDWKQGDCAKTMQACEPLDGGDEIAKGEVGRFDEFDDLSDAMIKFGEETRRIDAEELEDERYFKQIQCPTGDQVQEPEVVIKKEVKPAKEALDIDDRLAVNSNAEEHPTDPCETVSGCKLDLCLDIADGATVKVCKATTADTELRDVVLQAGDKGIVQRGATEKNDFDEEEPCVNFQESRPDLEEKKEDDNYGECQYIVHGDLRNFVMGDDECGFKQKVVLGETSLRFRGFKQKASRPWNDKEAVLGSQAEQIIDDTKRGWWKVKGPGGKLKWVKPERNLCIVPDR